MKEPYTPRPWMRNGTTLEDWHRIDGASERVGLEFMTNPAALLPNEEDADFVVLAVNSYQAMLDALRFERQTSLAADAEAYPQFVEMRDAAIKRAEG